MGMLFFAPAFGTDKDTPYCGDEIDQQHHIAPQKGKKVTWADDVNKPLKTECRFLAFKVSDAEEQKKKREQEEAKKSNEICKAIDENRRNLQDATQQYHQKIALIEQQGHAEMMRRVYISAGVLIPLWLLIIYQCYHNFWATQDEEQPNDEMMKESTTNG